jgi:hypothetical protein
VVVMKSTIFWDIMMCSPLKVNRRFRGTSPPSSGSKNKPIKKPGSSFLIETGTLTILTEDFHGFVQPLHVNTWIVP